MAAGLAKSILTIVIILGHASKLPLLLLFLIFCRTHNVGDEVLIPEYFPSRCSRYALGKLSPTFETINDLVDISLIQRLFSTRWARVQQCTPELLHIDLAAIVFIKSCKRIGQLLLRRQRRKQRGERM